MDEHWVGAPDLSGSTCSEEWVSVSNDVSLRVLHWTPDNKALQDARPLMMVPGWGSVFEGWRPWYAYAPAREGHTNPTP